MGCCKCYNPNIEWNDPQPVVYVDANGFEYCIFHAPAGFKCKRLDCDSVFTHEEFNDLVFARINTYGSECSKIETGCYCDLGQTVFPGKISFSRYDKNSPLPSVSFFDVVFCDDVCFENVLFSGESCFSGANFIGSVNFDNAKFCEEANFISSKFHNEVSFFDASTEKAADFSFVKCYKDIYFSGITINAKLRFVRAVFCKHCYLNIGSAPDRSVNFERMSASSLSKVVFSLHDVALIGFRDCVMPERLAVENDAMVSSAECEEIYRAMKMRAVEDHNQPLVSRWHFLEKLMHLNGLYGREYVQFVLNRYRARKTKSLWSRSRMRVVSSMPVPLRSLTWWYYACSGFGERAVRAGVCLAILIGLSFLANITPQPWDWSALPGSAAASATMATIPFAKDIPGDGWVKVGRGFWQFLIAVQFTLFALAVRNRFRR